MATPEEITAFRLIIDEQDGTVYSDDLLNSRISTADNLDMLAEQIWLEKAAKYARLVDIQEGTSRRSLSQMQTQALAMAAKYGALVDVDTTSPVGKRTTTRAIERA